MLKILFLAVNPSNTTRLRLDQEIRAIDEKLRQAEFRDKYEIEQQWAVRVSDLQGHLLHHKPNIVHFSGHGSSASEILLEDESGDSHPVSVKALSQLFSILKDDIRCVVLNACYSEPQARAIAEHIEHVVGMSKAISDEAAISFAAVFYQALGYDKNYKTAYDLGCSQIALENLNEQDIPKFLAYTGSQTARSRSIRQDSAPCRLAFASIAIAATNTSWKESRKSLTPKIHFGRECRQGFQPTTHATNADPSFDITLFNKSDEPIILNEIGIEIVTVEDLIIMRGIPQAIEIKNAGSCTIEMPTIEMPDRAMIRMWASTDHGETKSHEIYLAY